MLSASNEVVGGKSGGSIARLAFRFADFISIEATILFEPRSQSFGFPFVVPDLDQVPARVEEVEVLARAARAASSRFRRVDRLVARTAHVSDRVEVISIFNFRVDDALENLV